MLGHLTHTVERALEELLVDPAHQRQVQRRVAARCVVEGCRRLSAGATAVGFARTRSGQYGIDPPSVSSLPGPGLEPSRQKIVGDSQFNNLCVKLLDRFLGDLRRLRSAATLECIRGPVQQDALPLVDHRRMHTEPACQLRDRLLAL